MRNGSIPARLGHLMIIKQASLQQPKELPTQSLTTVFTQGVGYENAAVTNLADGALITVVKKTYSPLMKADALPEQLERLSADNAQLLYDGIVASYADKLNIKVNDTAIKKAFSVYQDE